jgi:hypothetical protein
MLKYAVGNIKSLSSYVKKRTAGRNLNRRPPWAQTSTKSGQEEISFVELLAIGTEI